MSVNQVTLPSEFFDLTSGKLLKQPEPQYFWAMMLAAADARSVLNKAGIQVGMPGRDVASQGLAYASELDRLQLAAASEAAEAVMAIEELGKGPGHTVRINRPAFSGGGYTVANRQVGVSDTISTSPQDISGEQTAVTLKRIVGPFASGGSAPQPYAIDAFAAKGSVHSLADIVGLHLRRDRMRYIDTVINLEFNKASTNVAYVNGATADNDYVDANAGLLNVNAVFDVEEKLASANIPTFSNGRWKLALTPKALRHLKTDSVYAHYAQHDAGMKNPLFPGYVATIGRLDIYEVNTFQTATNSSSVVVERNIAFGPGAVGYGVGLRPEVRASTDDNYAETPKVIWICYEGHECLDERFLVSLRTTQGS